MQAWLLIGNRKTLYFQRSTVGGGADSLGSMSAAPATTFALGGLVAKGARAHCD